MMKNKILILIMTLCLVLFYGCKHAIGSDMPETGNITITGNEENDFAITETEIDGKIVLTASQGYSDYKWYLDADFTVVSETDTYIFTSSEDCTMIFVTAKKNGAEYSATYYILK